MEHCVKRSIKRVISRIGDHSIDEGHFTLLEQDHPSLLTGQHAGVQGA